MFSRFFIERPIFASVVSIILCLAGLVAMSALPVEQYPTITPVQVTVSATYPGADSKTLADSVAAPIEAQINGVDNMIYMSSTSSSTGMLTITVYFTLDTDPDVAQVQVQNRVNLAAPQLPVGRGAAGRLGAEEVVVDHDADRHLLEGEALQPRVHRQLRERLRPRRAQAGAGGRPGLDHGRPRPGHADLDEPGPHGLARDHHQRHPEGGAEPERPLRGGADRPAAHGGARGADLPGRHPAAVHRARGLREHHPPRRPGRGGHRPPEGRGPGRGGAPAVRHGQPAQRPARHLHRRLPAARRQRAPGLGGGPRRRSRG